MVRVALREAIEVFARAPDRGLVTASAADPGKETCAALEEIHRFARVRLGRARIAAIDAAGVEHRIAGHREHGGTARARARPRDLKSGTPQILRPAAGPIGDALQLAGRRLRPRNATSEIFVRLRERRRNRGFQRGIPVPDERLAVGKLQLTIRIAGIRCDCATVDLAVQCLAVGRCEERFLETERVDDP